MLDLAYRIFAYVFLVIVCCFGALAFSIGMFIGLPRAVGRKMRGGVPQDKAAHTGMPTTLSQDEIAEFRTIVDRLRQHPPSQS